MSNLVLSFADISEEELAYVGGKGGSLARLSRASFPVPDGFVISPSAFLGDALTPDAWRQIQSRLNRLRQPDGNSLFAVRSSAMSEDSVQASFAGEFESVLNGQTDTEIQEAIHRVYSSRQNERVQAYSQAQGMGGDHEIAVIVQQLVLAESSGVLFTANPITGQRDQAVISAAWGLGEAIVGGLVTPDTIIVEKATGRVLKRETAVKQLMTVRRDSGTEEQPTPKKLRQKAVLTDRQAKKLVQIGVQIETLYGMPMDIEWTLAKGKFAIVQARPITALPDPELPVPTEWKLPQGAYAAMRNNIVELMADPLTPLFRTLGLNAVNTSMNRLLTSFFGKSGIMPKELIISVNEYAYYNGSVKFLPMMQIILDTGGILKRMFTGAVERWIEDGRPQYQNTVTMWQSQEWAALPSTELLNAVRQLTEAAIDAYGALVSGVIPAAWMSEAWFTFINKLVKRRDDPNAPTYLMGFDSLPIRAEKSLYDLAQWTQGQTKLADYLIETPTSQLVAQLGENRTPSTIDTSDWDVWHGRFQTYLQQYGHTIYNLDFGSPVPADDPAPTLETFKMFLAGQGVNPHKRQQESARSREGATEIMQKRLKRLRLKLFQKNLERAQRYAPLREDGLADVGLSYPLLRQMLFELGQRFVNAGMIEKSDDIFWLSEEEVEDAAVRLDREQTLKNLSANIPQRQEIWRAAQRVSPPMMLPQMKIFGFDLMQIKTGRSKNARGGILKGVAASPGTVTAPACIVHGPQDFAQMKTGDVLVAPLTTPAWTPLFVRASAVVTDVGGPLSHGSIVAREYGIPAVLGTGTATNCIRNGQIITVDGSAGKIAIS